jgi:phosphohistidine phosphatase SixA
MLSTPLSSWRRGRSQARLALLALAFAAASASSLAAQQAVFVVRHAEKTDQSADPDLSPAGRARAERLGALLADAGVSAVFATEFRRTQQTVAPLAGRLGIAPQVVKADDVAGLVARIRAAQAAGVVVVAWHSNSVPRILAELGAAPPVTIADDEFDNLFVVVPRGPGPPVLLRLRY